MTASAGLATATQQDLAVLTDQELDSLLEMVRIESCRRRDRLLISAVPAEIAADLDLRSYEDLGAVVKVVFPAWGWDNGWFFQERAARIFDARGRQEDYDFGDSDTITNLLADASRAFDLGPTATMTIDLISGSIGVDTYDEDGE